MVLRTRVFVILLSAVVLAVVINLVRTKKLREEYALMWLITAIVLFVTPLSIDFLDAIAFAIGVDYPPGLLFLIAFVGVLFILFQFSLVISRFTDQIKNLAQDLGLLERRLRDLEERLNAQDAEEGNP